MGSIKRFAKLLLFGMPKASVNQGCQMAYFQTKNPDLGKFWRVLQSKMLVYFMAIWYILWSFGICCGNLVYFIEIWFIFPRFVMLYQEKSGNPGPDGVVEKSPKI
jgi:hypothetical protein